MKYSKESLHRELTVEDLPSIITTLSDRIALLESTITPHPAKRDQEDSRKTIGPGEAAHMLKLSKSRVYVLCSEGKLPVHKVGHKLLFFPNELEQFIRSGGRIASAGNQTSWNKKADAL